MAEERRDCTKCINNNGCYIHCICHDQDKWQPIAQEKPMENKKCTNCGCEEFIKDKICECCGKEYKPMENKVIFESEEELFSFMNETFGQNDKIDKGSRFWIHGVSIAKAHGYIRKSAVEEAEEMYNTIMHGNTVPTWDQLDRIITKYREAVQELKSEIARLKK